MTRIAGRLQKPWDVGAHMRGLCESSLMNSNMAGFRLFFKKLCDLVLLDESSLSIEQVTFLSEDKC